MSDYLLGIDAVSQAAVAESVSEDDESEVLARRAVAEIEAATRAVPSSGSPALRPFDPGDRLVPQAPRVLKSEIDGVSDEAWTEFARALKTAEPGAVSASNALGMFELRPRRLADLGIMRNVSMVRSPTKRMVWVGEFVKGTQKQFLASPKAQYEAFAKSMGLYVDGLRDGSIARPDGGVPDGMTLSGVLGILHRCGPSGLKNWNDEDKRFDETIALFQRTNGIF